MEITEFCKQVKYPNLIYQMEHQNVLIRIKYVILAKYSKYILCGVSYMPQLKLNGYYAAVMHMLLSVWRLSICET